MMYAEGASQLWYIYDPHASVFDPFQPDRQINGFAGPWSNRSRPTLKLQQCVLSNDKPRPKSGMKCPASVDRAVEPERSPATCKDVGLKATDSCLGLEAHFW